jgi:hypothetical protein
MTDLKILFPEPVTVEVMGKVVSIHPVRLRDFEAFGAASGLLIAALSDPSRGAVLAYATKHKNLRAILGTSTSLSAWAIWRLPAATAVELMVHVVRVNAGFFDQALISLAGAFPGQK